MLWQKIVGDGTPSKAEGKQKLVEILDNIWQKRTKKTRGVSLKLEECQDTKESAEIKKKWSWFILYVP